MHTYKMKIAKPFRYSLPVTDKWSNFSNENGKAIFIVKKGDAASRSGYFLMIDAYIQDRFHEGEGSLDPGERPCMQPHLAP